MSFIIILAIFIKEFLTSLGLSNFQNHFRIGFWSPHTDRTSRTGPGSRCSRRRRLKTTQQLWRANFTQFSPRASQLNLERRSVCKTQTSVGNIVVVTAFFSWWKIRGLLSSSFFGPCFIEGYWRPGRSFSLVTFLYKETLGIPSVWQRIQWR